MTSPMAIRGVMQWNRWSTDHSPLLKSEDSENSEGRSRVPGGGIRLLPVVRYGFILLALCLLLSDTFHLAHAASSSQHVGATPQSVRNVRTVHGNSHARLAGAKRHSGV
jgi:hypothetical protein